jgi:phage terminase small subunit
MAKRRRKPKRLRRGQRPPTELTLQQQRFAAELVACGNATEAAKRAGYSPHSADEIAAQLMRRPHVAAEVARCQARVLKRLEISAETVLAELGRLARSDVGECFGADGRLLPIHTLPEWARAAIASVEIGEDGRPTRIRLWDKNAALANLAKHHKLLTDRVEHTVLGVVGLEVLARMSQEELEAGLDEVIEQAQATKARLGRV